MSVLETALSLQISAVKRLPQPQREYRFHPVRKWRFDLAWPERLFAVEIEGGLFVTGRHSRGVGQLADMEKVATAMMMGWRVLRVGGKHIQTGAALGWIAAILEME